METKTSTQPINADLITQIQRHILDEGNRFIMSRGLVRTTPGSAIVDRIATRDLRTSRKFEVHPPCGTAACIGGWSVLLGGISPQVAQAFSWDVMHTRAAEFLRVDPRVALRLFLAYRWPDPYYTLFRNARSAQKRARVAADLLEYVKWYGIDWDAKGDKRPYMVCPYKPKPIPRASKSA